MRTTANYTDPDEAFTDPDKALTDPDKALTVPDGAKTDSSELKNIKGKSINNPLRARIGHAIPIFTSPEKWRESAPFLLADIARR